MARVYIIPDDNDLRWVRFVRQHMRQHYPPHLNRLADSPSWNGHLNICAFHWPLWPSW
ncbi:hypothetical protein PLUA15_290059 [Pseudomonas lundensis]|uniref:Uncharacterized protein n=1 Tax=Pseudomonas lundensis TaxID=86185 RepID=A0AAX2HA72_9PSED|nr:hypothetical protein PLUA15_290059 [Pseudomonas lundensis]